MLLLVYEQTHTQTRSIIYCRLVGVDLFSDETILFKKISISLSPMMHLSLSMHKRTAARAIFQNSMAFSISFYIIISISGEFIESEA